MNQTTISQLTRSVFSDTTPGDADTKQDILSAKQALYFAFLVVVSLVGTCGNAMTLLAVKGENRLKKKASTYLISNLALADLVVCVLAIPVILTKTASGEPSANNIQCYVTAIASSVACHTASLAMACIALNGYLATAYSNKYLNKATKTKVLIVNLATWLLGTICTAPLIVGWLELNYNQDKHVCLCLDGGFPLKYTVPSVFTGHLIPYCVTLYCHTRIFMALFESRNRLEKHRSPFRCSGTFSRRKNFITHLPSTGALTAETRHRLSNKTTLSVKRWSRHEIQMFKASSLTFAVFALCGVPHVVLVLLGEYGSVQLKEIIGFLCLLSFSLNPIFYGVTNETYQKAYKRLLKKVFCNIRKDVEDKQGFVKKV